MRKVWSCILGFEWHAYIGAILVRFRVEDGRKEGWAREPFLSEGQGEDRGEDDGNGNGEEHRASEPFFWQAEARVEAMQVLDHVRYLQRVRRRVW